MNQEFETKVLDVNPEEIIQKLRSLGAEESDEVLMRRWVFDSKKGDKEWIRLRDNGKKVTLAFKQKSDGSVGGTKEIEVEVSDFDKTAEIFHSIPFEKIYYQENKRHEFVLGDITFCIDTWPMISPHLEVESNNPEGVQKGLSLLELTGKDVGDLDVEIIFKDCGMDFHSFAVLKF